MYASFSASVFLMSPLFLTPLTTTLPASSILKNLKQRLYSVRIASNNSGSVAAPTSNNAILLMWKVSRMGLDDALQFLLQKLQLTILYYRPYVGFRIKQYVHSLSDNGKFNNFKYSMIPLRYNSAGSVMPVAERRSKI